MSLLGEFIKQPVEVEMYAIHFEKDMASSDQIESAWQVIALDRSAPWDQVVQTAPYQATLTDADRIFVTSSDITLPLSPPEGYRISVANIGESTGIFVDSIAIPARGAAVVTLKNGFWVTEAKSTAVVVNAVNDQRVRVRVFGGFPFNIYKVQVTVNTSEGRTLQDEFTVEIEES